MVDYKKAYAMLVGAVDECLFRLKKVQPGGLPAAEEIQKRLQRALLEAEDYVIDNMEEEEEEFLTQFGPTNTCILP